MTRKQIDQLEQSGAYIEQMYHTLASHESSTFNSFLEDIVPQDYEKIYEGISEDVFDEYYDQRELPQMMIDFSLYGFIAEIRMPERSNFRFDEDGSFKSCQINPSIMRSEYVFGETMDQLVEKATAIGNDYKKQQVDKARLKYFKRKD